MALFYTTEAAAQNSNADKTRPNASDLAGRQRVAVVQYTTDGTEVTTDTLALFKVLHPIQIDPTQSSVHITAALAATSATLDIGDDPLWNDSTPDVDRFADGIDVGAAGLDLFTAPAIPAAVGTPFTTSESGFITATMALSGTTATGAVLTFRIVYTVK